MCVGAGIDRFQRGEWRGGVARGLASIDAGHSVNMGAERAGVCVPCVVARQTSNGEAWAGYALFIGVPEGFRSGGFV